MQHPISPAAPAPPQDSPASESSADERDAELRRQLRALALALFAWTAKEPDLAHSTASERMLARVIRPMLPRMRDALLSRLSSADPAALEAIIGASASALESILYYAPGAARPRYAFRWQPGADGQPAVELVPLADG